MPPERISLDIFVADPTKLATLTLDDRARVLLACSALIAAAAAITSSGNPDAAFHRDGEHRPADPAVAPPEERLLSVPEAAQFLGFANSYVYELIRRSEFPAVRRGKYVRIRRSALMEWVARKEKRA